jgi:hypothetical protein
LKWVIGLQDRPEVLLIAEKTSKEPELVAALCMVAWAWADTEGHDGIVAGATLTMLDLVTKKAPGFGSAMAETPWLKATADGLHFTGWETHNSQSAKDRALDQKRKAETNRTETGRRPETNRTETGPEKRRVEKSRVEKRRVEMSRSDAAPEKTNIKTTGTGEDFCIEESETGSDRKARPFVQVFILKVAEAFGWTSVTAMQQRKSLSAIARRLLKEPDRDDLASDLVALARSKADDPALEKPVAAWQKEVTRTLAARDAKRKA